MTKLPSIMDYTVQENKIVGEYKEYLHTPLFDVNVRLYSSSRQYRWVVNESLNYLDSMFLREFSDYPEIKGVSGANLGIPFNIISVRLRDDSILSMINPKILERSKKTKTVESNCGSLVLDKPVKVTRNTEIKIEYCTEASCYESGKLMRVERRFKDSEAFTIQHEIDHNNGITILDMAAWSGDD